MNIIRVSAMQRPAPSGSSPMFLLGFRRWGKMELHWGASHTKKKKDASFLLRRAYP